MVPWAPFTRQIAAWAMIFAASGWAAAAGLLSAGAGGVGCATAMLPAQIAIAKIVRPFIAHPSKTIPLNLPALSIAGCHPFGEYRGSCAQGLWFLQESLECLGTIVSGRE